MSRRSKDSGPGKENREVASGIHPADGAHHVSLGLSLVAATVISSPVLIQGAMGQREASSAILWFLSAIALCWLAGAVVIQLIDSMESAAEARTRRAPAPAAPAAAPSKASAMVDELLDSEDDDTYDLDVDRTSSYDDVAGTMPAHR